MGNSKVFGLNLKSMSDEQLAQLIELDMHLDTEKETDSLKELINKLIFVEAKKRKGKTAWAMATAWKLREYFDKPVVCVGTKMGLKPEFGPFDYISEAEWREELEKITVAANENENAEKVNEVFRAKGIHIIGATVLFDEAYKLMWSRTPQDKIVKLTVQWVSQVGHYDCTCIVLAPIEAMIDKLIRPQFDWKGQAFFNKYTKVVTVRLQYGIDVLTFTVDLLDGSTHIPFGDMYNTTNITGYRAQTLSAPKI